jgi:acetyl-CoA acetyltransferase
MTDKLIGEHHAVISGVGQSEVGRRLLRNGNDLTVEAALRAIEDAGLSRADIDGVSTWPGGHGVDGMSPSGAPDLKEALRLELNWWSGGSETAGQYGAVFNAIAAVSAGFANHVVCFRTVTEATASVQMTGGHTSLVGMGPSRVTGFPQWMSPFNAYSAANWIGMFAQRYMHEFGLTREQLGQIALTCRRNAALNPAAIYRDPLTLDDYLSARMISTPFCLYDCDVPVDGSTAVIVSRAETAPDLRKPPIRIEAAGMRLAERHSWDQRTDLTTMAAWDAAHAMWARTDLRPADVDVVELYDGFSFIALCWLEALGFFGKGEGGPFLEGGTNISLRGPLPFNTHGGQLSAGRMHGYGFLHEACRQLWGEASDRQVPDAEVGVAAAGGGPLGGCLLLTRS